MTHLWVLTEPSEMTGLMHCPCTCKERSFCYHGQYTIGQCHSDTHWLVDYHFEASSLALQGLPSWVFAPRAGPVSMRAWSWWVNNISPVDGCWAGWKIFTCCPTPIELLKPRQFGLSFVSPLCGTEQTHREEPVDHTVTLILSIP